MFDKLAVKRLTASDLTFFEWHFRNNYAGNQKAINLNADVFRGQLFPAVDVVASRSGDRLGVDLWVGGPGGAEFVNLQRKIIKGPSYKNWRLDGEFIHDPEGASGRFAALQPRDVAVMGFDGELAPNSVILVLVARSSEADRAVAAQLGDLMGGRRMLRIEADQLRDVCVKAEVGRTHPIWRLVTDEDVVEAAAGIWPAVARVLRRTRQAPNTRVTAEDLRKGRAIAEETGRLGEVFVNRFLQESCDLGAVDEYDWTSARNPVAPYDFRVCVEGVWEKWEVKTTLGAFSRDYYRPRSELREMAAGDGVYKVVRVYNVQSDRVQMRVSRDLRDFGRSILDQCGELPAGVMLNGVTVTPRSDWFEDAVDLAPLRGKDYGDA